MSLGIGILVLAAGRQAGGPETYELELLRALARLDSTNSYTIYCTSEDAVRAIDIAQANFRFEVLRPRSRFLSLSLTLPGLLHRSRIDVLHATYAPPLSSPPCPLVFTSHGLVNFHFPELFPRSTRLRLNALHRLGMRTAQRIICVSQHTYQQLQEDRRIDASRLCLIHHGVDPIFRPRPKREAQRDVEQTWGISSPYILFVGKLQQVKNIDRLLKAFRHFRQQNPAVKLVLAGRQVESISLLKEAEFTSNVVQLGYIANDRLPALYQAAEMLVLPSLFESFGLPVIEAMRCGLPVIASRAGALPEVCGGAARLIDPLRTEDISTAMCDLFHSDAVRACLRDQGFARAENFSWDAAAQATLGVYQRTSNGLPESA